MRVLYALLFMLTVVSCQPSEPTHLLVGNWQWVASSGGIGGTLYKPDPEKRVVVNFSVDGRYTITSEGTLVSSGEYDFTTVKSIRDHKDGPALQVKSTVIHTPNKPVPFGLQAMFPYVIVATTVNELELSDNFYDGFGHTFRRITEQ